MHTTVSDGTDTPEQILEKVRLEGITIFAVTDHDDIKGCRRIMDAGVAGDPKFITGVEFNSRDKSGKYHILGYGYDPEAPSINRLVQAGHGYRMNKVRGRIEGLKEKYGFDFPPEEIEALIALDNPGKPHIANLMVKYGYAMSKEDGIDNYLNTLKIKAEYLDPETAIKGIKEAGGIPVLAHPSYGSGDELIIGDELTGRIQRLKSYGLEGVEAFYSGFTDVLRDEVLAIAERENLYVTAGSDYHGKNKMVLLGDNGLDGYGKMPESMTRFLERCMGLMSLYQQHTMKG